MIRYGEIFIMKIQRGLQALGGNQAVRPEGAGVEVALKGRQMTCPSPI